MPCALFTMANGGEDYPDNLLLEAILAYEQSCQQPESYDILPDDLLLEALKNFEDTETGQSVVTVPCESQRFSAPVSDGELQDYIKQGIPKNTRQQTSWAVKVWKSWRDNRIETTGVEVPELLEMTKENMSNWISKFLIEVRRVDGNDYTGESLYQMLCGLLRHLRLNGREEIDFFQDVVFKPMLAVLDNKMKSLKCNGIGVTKKQAEPISQAEEGLLWSQGLLGDSSPGVLLDSMIWMCGLFFALRGGTELRDLKRQQIKLVESSDGSYLEYQENVSKNNPGGLRHRKVEPKTVTHFENRSNPSRCFIRLYKLYISKYPSNAANGAFFLRLLVRPKENQWYSCQPIGHNNLGSTIKRLCEKAGITGNKTNHSLRASAATRLFHGNISEQMIMKVTGHRSTDGVRSYKKVVRDQFRDVSSVLQGGPDENVETVENDCKENVHIPGHESTTPVNQEKQSSPPHQVVLNGCTNITFNY